MADAENQVVSSVNYLDEDSGRDRNGRRLYPVMSATFRKFFEGRNYRWLEPVRGMDRVTFLTKCADIVERTARESLEMAVEAAGPKGLSERGRRDALDSGRMAAMRRLGLSYLFYFAVVILKHDWLNNDYAYRLCLDVQKNKWSKHVMLWIIAREHYKSTIITKISTLWEIMQNPENTYCIMTFEEGLSVDFLGYIKTQCETNELLRALYPDVIWEDPAKGYQVDESTGVKTTWTWNSTALEFRRQSHPNEKTVEAFAVRGGSITGRHFSHLIMDDIETESMTKTENFIENMKNTVTNLFKAGRSDDLHVTMVGTFYTVNDLYCKLIKDDIIDESIIQSAIDQETRHPIKYTDEAMEQVIKSSTPAIFATQVMCDPSFSISAKFVYDRILRWHPVNLDGLNIYVFVDPAGTKTNRSDYTAILTAGYDINRNVMVIDLIRDKLTLDEKFSHLARIMRRYRPIAIYYEQVGMQADIAYLQQKMQQTNIRFPIIPESPPRGVTKQVRIEQIIFRMNTIYLPHPGDNVFINWQGVPEDMVESMVNDEMMPFPNATHDDALDTLAKAVAAMDGGFVAVPDMEELRTGAGAGGQIEADYDPMDYAKRLISG